MKKALIEQSKLSEGSPGNLVRKKPGAKLTGCLHTSEDLNKITAEISRSPKRIVSENKV